MPIERTERQADLDQTGTDRPPGPGGLVLTTLWFGLLAGWLEVGLVLTQRAVNLHVSYDALRTNRHFVWMVPVCNLLLFAAVVLTTALLAKWRPGLARWAAVRLPVALGFLGMLLSVEGLHPAACVVLACGLASTLGPWLGRRSAGLDRLARLSFPVLGVLLAVLAGLTFVRVMSAERRALAACPPATPGAPNVLLIVLDTVRAASLSLYGSNRPTSPNLQRLASRGVVFSEARATAPWTLPSHASMFTGRWPHELSVGPDLPLDGTFPTLADVLARRGYATAGFVGNTRYCNARYGLARGFARYEDDYENRTVSVFEVLWSSGLGRRVLQGLGYPIRCAEGGTSVRKTAAMLNRDVCAWLANRPADRPFFAFVNYYDAHPPYIPPDDADQRFGMAALPLARQLEIEKTYLDLLANPGPTGAPPEWAVRDAMELYRDGYESCIAYLDRQVGLLLDEFGRRGLLDNTLVVVTSDHGEHLGEHDLLGHGLSLYRPEVHVPLIVVPPARPEAARVVHEPVSLREVAATVFACVAPGSPSPFPGRPLTRFLTEEAPQGGESSPVLSEVQQITIRPPTANVPSSLGPVRSLVSGDRVYIRSEGEREELYDRVNDPLESLDLAGYARSGPDLERLRDEITRICRGTTEPNR